MKRGASLLFCCKLCVQVKIQPTSVSTKVLKAHFVVHQSFVVQGLGLFSTSNPHSPCLSPLHCQGDTKTPSSSLSPLHCQGDTKHPPPLPSSSFSQALIWGRHFAPFLHCQGDTKHPPPPPPLSSFSQALLIWGCHFAPFLHFQGDTEHPPSSSLSEALIWGLSFCTLFALSIEVHCSTVLILHFSVS